MEGGVPQGKAVRTFDTFYEGQNDPRVNLTDSPHFTPADLANIET